MFQLKNDAINHDNLPFSINNIAPALTGFFLMVFYYVLTYMNGTLTNLHSQCYMKYLLFEQAYKITS